MCRADLACQFGDGVQELIEQLLRDTALPYVSV